MPLFGALDVLGVAAAKMSDIVAKLKANTD
jgi:hypothetical protein